MFAFLRSRSVPPAVIDAPLLDTLADAHAAAEAGADAAFTPERADAQRAAILARLGAAADQRVLSFPPRAAEPARRAGARAPRPALGWMLTAAAAGLVVGVGTGQGIYLEWPGRETTRVRATAPPVPVAVPARAVEAVEADDAILSDVEVALSRRGVDELQPLDELTPRVTLVASR
jgi:hypothetical protein